MIKVNNNTIEGISVFKYTDTELELDMCGLGDKYPEKEDLPIVLTDPSDFYLIKECKPWQNIVYNHDRKWTLKEAKLYLKCLLEAFNSTYNIPVLRLYRFWPEQDNQFSRTFNCEGCRHRNLTITENHDCTTLYKELSDKCAYCPIGRGCPICNYVCKSNICYMHQAEAIAAIIVSQCNGIYTPYIWSITIPYIWAKEFGDDIYNKVVRIRESVFNIYTASDLVYRHRVLIDKYSNSYENYEKAVDLIKRSPLKYKENKDGIMFVADQGTINLLLIYVINLHYTVFSFDIEQSTNPITIRGIEFGPNGIPLKDNGILGDPSNQFTYSILYYMKDYISKDSNVLDIGCGKGTTTLYAHKCGAKSVTAIDIDREAVNATRDLVKECGDDSITVLRRDVFDMIACNVFNWDGNIKTYDLIIGNLCYPIQRDLLPKISNLLNDGGIYIMGGIPIMIEKKVLEIKHNDLKLIDIKYVYNSVVIIFKKEVDDI